MGGAHQHFTVTASTSATPLSGGLPKQGYCPVVVMSAQNKHGRSPGWTLLHAAAYTEDFIAGCDESVLGDVNYR